jgi:hypothetical protein
MSDDPWLEGPWKAGPVQPILKPFGIEPSTQTTTPPHLKPLWEVGRVMVKYIRDPRTPEFARLMESVPYAFVFAMAFDRGFLSGSLHGLSEWVRDIQEWSEAHFGEPIALSWQLGVELGRAFTEENPTGLSTDTRRVIEASNLLAPLKLLTCLTVENDLNAFLSRIGLLVEDIVQMKIEMGDEWLDEFFTANGDANRQGFLAGELFGVAAVQTIVAIVSDTPVPVPL